MNHSYIKVSDLAQRVLFEQRMKRLFEDTKSTANSILQQTQSLSKELKADGEDVSDDEVQAAMLSALVDANGNVSAVDVSDVENIKTEIKESKGYAINESSDGFIHAIEMVGNILGNTALLNEISAAIEELTGLKISTSKLQKGLNSFFKGLKKVTGYPAKVIEKAFAWISKKLGAGEWGQKVAGYSGLLVLVLVLGTIGVMHFPVLGASSLGMLFSVTGLLGKGAETINLVKKIFALIKQKIEENPDIMKGQEDDAEFSDTRLQ
jgi:hypothetical protein